MKTVLLVLATAVVAAFASVHIEIDWSRVKPLTDYPEFLKGKLFRKPLLNQFKYDDINQQVSNGNVAGRHDFPFKAALISEMPFGDVLCGGALISRWSVLTAAHCIHRATGAVVILGASDIRNPAEPHQVRFRETSANFRIHHHFREGVTNSDIGVVRLTFPIAVFTAAVSAIAIPTDTMVTDLFTNENAIVAGFGRYTDSENYSPNLRFVEVNTLPNSGITGCAIRFPSMIDHSHICTSGLAGRGWCPGDEGAPLIVLRGGVYIQIGVASIFPGSGCSSGNPSVYTRTTSFLSFIRQNM